MSQEAFSQEITAVMLMKYNYVSITPIRYRTFEMDLMKNIKLIADQISIPILSTLISALTNHLYVIEN